MQIVVKVIPIECFQCILVSFLPQLVIGESQVIILLVPDENLDVQHQNQFSQVLQIVLVLVKHSVIVSPDTLWSILLCN